MYLLLIKDAGYPYCPASSLDSGEYLLQPWLRDKMKLKYTTHCQHSLSFDKKWLAGQWAEQAKEIKSLLEEHGVANLPVGIDTHFGIDIVDACRKAGINLVDGNHVMAAARMIKTQDEIECLRTAGAITESAHWEVCKALKPGVTEWQMNGVVAKALYDLGAEELEGPSYVISSGNRTGHSLPAMPTDRIVRPGDLFVIDINGVSFQGYRTCFFRAYVVGDKPTEFQKEVYQCAYEAVTAMSNSIKAGITNQEAAESWMEKGRKPGGWGSQPKWPAPGRYYAFSGGHPIGLCSGDPGPGITQTLRDPESPPLMLEKNMCFAQECGCYTWDGSKWAYDGVKLEYCGRVTEDGFEVFYRFPIKDLIACGLPGTY